MNYKLIVAVLFAAPLMAMSYEDAEQKVAAADAKVEAALRRVDNLHKHIHAVNGKASSHTVGSEIAQLNQETSAKISEHKQACKALAEAVRERAALHREVGPHHTVSSSTEGKYTVAKANTTPLAPVVVNSPTAYRGVASAARPF